LFTTNISEEDEFLILASDGVWSVCTNDEACECIRESLRRFSPSSLGESIAHEAAVKAADDLGMCSLRIHI
jgi:serine/threonine protein phosphatase PrpC